MLGIRHHSDVSLDLFQGDLTTFVCDAMVNAANTALAGGGGVDGAIHKAGGPKIVRACLELGGCATGKAVTTISGKLPCKKVIHTVGPIWQGGNSGEAALLASCYKESLQQAASYKMGHVAFSAISTGVYGYPLYKAATIAMKATREFLTAQAASGIRRITFVLFNQTLYEAFRASLYEAFPEGTD
jgi:O-acetyl-ADP-ribose deacetylase (regulator of RNase III)